MEVAAELLSAEAAQLAPPLCQVLRWLLRCILLASMAPRQRTTLPLFSGCCSGWVYAALDLHKTVRRMFEACSFAECLHEGSVGVQVIRVLVVRLQQQALGWTAGAAPHRTGESVQAPTADRCLCRLQVRLSPYCFRSPKIPLQCLLCSNRCTSTCRLWVTGAEPRSTEAAAAPAAAEQQEGGGQGPPPGRPPGLPAGLPRPAHCARLCRPVPGCHLRLASRSRHTASAVPCNDHCNC